MLAMSDINCIKHLRNQKGLSITNIAETLQINWRTAKKYGDQEQPPSSKIKKKGGMMYTENWGTMVSDWLFEDWKLKKKLRRNKKQLFEELKTYGFPGSYRTVCLFIQQWESEHQDGIPDKGHERLEHPPAEAQVDFGIMEAVEDGEIRDIHALVMSFPYSNGAFCVPFPSENQECFLEGLKKLFDQAGGVPRKIRIDNLTPAVKQTRTKHKEAELTDDFLAFQGHYGFEVQVCNPRKGNEKGHVERKVGYVRYNFFSTVPVMDNLEDLSNKVFTRLVEDRNRLHYEKQILIDELWQQEKEYLLALPDTPYPVFKETIIKLNKYNEFSLDGHLIHIPKAKNYLHLYCRREWDRIFVITDNGEIILEDFRPYMKKRRFLPWVDIIKGWLEKPRVVGYSRYQKYLPGRLKDYLLVESIQIRKKRLNEMLNLLVRYDLKAINENFYELIGQSIQEEDHPYGVNWESYDSLQPSSKEVGENGQ